MCKFALIGKDISHSESPALFREAYEGRWDYGLLDCATFEEGLKTFAQGPYKAVNVTSPYKREAALAASERAREVEITQSANILVKKDDGALVAYNSDYRAFRRILSRIPGSVTVIGSGGVGRSALAAANSLGRRTTLLHHDNCLGAKNDIIVYALPKKVDATPTLVARTLVECNYKDPVCEDLPGVENYISGRVLLREQAREGYPLMTGLETKL